MDLRGFERGARVMFSFPSAAKILVVDAALAPLSLIAGCSPLYLMHVLLILPLAFTLLAGKLANLRRAYGLSPLFLAWGTATSWLRGYSSLMLLPPSLLLTIPLRFFTGSAVRGYLPSLLALLLMTISATPMQLAIAASLAILSAASVEALARWLDRRITEVSESGLRLVMALINYVLGGDKESFEEELKTLGRRRRVPIYALDLLDDMGRVWGIVTIPHVHPGPYRDVGSSNMPSRLATAASHRGLEIVVLHGASSHGEDLASSGDVDRLIQLLLGGYGEVLCEGARLGVGLASNEHFRALALCLEGGAAIVVTERLDGGMEDVPLQLVSHLHSTGAIALVDAHNSYDESCPSPSPGSALASSLLSCVRAALEAARSQMKDGWHVSIASMRGKYDLEVGSAGISVLTLTNARQLLLVTFDSNNMLRELRDRLYASFSDKADIMIATTDTHELTGAIAGETYRPLGTSMRLDELRELINTLVDQALRNLRPLRYRFRRIDFEGVFLNPQKLELLSRTAEKAIKYAFTLLSAHALIFLLTPLLI
ncbi:MAG: hypothetical protein DRJ57_01185 [Thermoprotei archaeon]|nr:MAG: hypothetical protein DRJ57_01185 [Thermoprotei archaeon]